MNNQVHKFLQTLSILIFVLTVHTDKHTFSSARSRKGYNPKNPCSKEGYNPCSQHFGAVGILEFRRCLHGKAERKRFEMSSFSCMLKESTPLEVWSKTFYESLLSQDKKNKRWKLHVLNGGEDIDLVWTNLYVNKTGGLVYRGAENAKLPYRPEGLAGATIGSCILLNIKTGIWSWDSCDKPAAATLCIKDVDSSKDSLTTGKQPKKSTIILEESTHSGSLYYPESYEITCHGLVGAKYTLKFKWTDTKGRPISVHGKYSYSEEFVQYMKDNGENECKRMVLMDYKFNTSFHMVEKGLTGLCSVHIPKITPCRNAGWCARKQFTVEAYHKKPIIRVKYHFLNALFIYQRANITCEACIGTQGDMTFAIKEDGTDALRSLEKNRRKKWIAGCGLKMTWTYTFNVKRSTENSLFLCESYGANKKNKLNTWFKGLKIIDGPKPPVLTVFYLEPPSGVEVGSVLIAICSACVEKAGEIAWSIVDVEYEHLHHLDTSFVVNTISETTDVNDCSRYHTSNVSLIISQEMIGKRIKCTSYNASHFDNLIVFSKILVNINAISILSGISWLVILLFISFLGVGATYPLYIYLKGAKSENDVAKDDNDLSDRLSIKTTEKQALAIQFINRLLIKDSGSIKSSHKSSRTRISVSTHKTSRTKISVSGGSSAIAETTFTETSSKGLPNDQKQLDLKSLQPSVHSSHSKEDSVDPPKKKFFLFG